MSSFDPVNKSYWLASLCESNYLKLARLIPDLDLIPPSASAQVDGKPSLLLKLIERSPYTLTLELSHCFAWGFETLLEPAVILRVYLDARVVEVLSDHARPFVRDAIKDGITPRGVMDYKWSLNYFLSQWLDHCLESHYSFTLADQPERSASLA